MRRTPLAGLALIAMLGASPASAQPGGAPRVALDWRDVSDRDVARCGLSRLRAGTLERLVDDGFAVVDTVDDRGVRVRVSSTEEGLRVDVETGGFVREETIPIPEACDATFVLEAISRIAEIVGDARRDAKATAPEESATDAVVVEPEQPSFRLSLDAMVKAAHPSEFVLFGGGLGARWALGRSFRLGGRTGATGSARSDVTLVEIEAALATSWTPPGSSVGLVVESGPIVHWGTSSELTATELDGYLGAGAEIGLGRFFFQGLAYGRLRRWEHRIDGEVAFDSRHLGLIVRFGAQLFDG